MLKLSNIHKTFQDGQNRLNHVLRGINLSVEKGDFVSIKGASGSGKTTLLSIMGTILLPDSGSYLLNGIELIDKNLDLSLIRNKQIGFVFQDHKLLPQLTAIENILLPTLAFQKKADDLQLEYAKQLMEFTDIKHITEQYPETLSGGETSRVALCRALIMKPLIILADEPTGQLDAENARNVALLLKKVNKELGTTIIMVTHSDETAAVANRILTLTSGFIHLKN
jgi:ABC-type lipoprotein export system ATPase subunit